MAWLRHCLAEGAAYPQHVYQGPEVGGCITASPCPLRWLGACMCISTCTAQTKAWAVHVPMLRTLGDLGLLPFHPLASPDVMPTRTFSSHNAQCFACASACHEGVTLVAELDHHILPGEFKFALTKPGGSTSRAIIPLSKLLQHPFTPALCLPQSATVANAPHWRWAALLPCGVIHAP